MGVPLWREPTADSSSQSAADKDPTAEARSAIRRRRSAIHESNRTRNARQARYATAFERSVDAQYETHDLRTRRGFGEPGHIIRIPVEHADTIGEADLLRDVGGTRYEYHGEVDGLLEFIARRVPSSSSNSPFLHRGPPDPSNSGVPSIAHLIRPRTRPPILRSRHTQDRDGSASPDSSLAPDTLFGQSRREDRNEAFNPVPPIIPQAPTPPPPPPPQRLSNPSSPRPRSRRGRQQSSSTQPAPSYHDLLRERRDSRNLRERTSRLRRQTQELRRATRSLRQQFEDDGASPYEHGPPIDGLGDRQRSWSPDSDNDQWETLLTTIAPDPSLPSASSSFASSAASFSNTAASQSSTNPTSVSSLHDSHALDQPSTHASRDSATTAATTNNPLAPQMQDLRDTQDCDADELFQFSASAHRRLRETTATQGSGNTDAPDTVSALSPPESIETPFELIRRSLEHVQRCNDQLMLALQADQIGSAEALPTLRAIHDAMENISTLAPQVFVFPRRSVTFDPCTDIIEQHGEIMRVVEADAEGQRAFDVENSGADGEVA